MKSISESDVISDITRVSGELDKNPSIVEYAEEGEFEPNDVIDLFGSWESAREAAGVNEPNSKWGLYKYVRSNGECQVCGESHDSCLVHHHVNPDEKVAAIRDIATDKKYDRDDLKEELEKCVLVCMNCHRKAHSPDHDLTITK